MSKDHAPGSGHRSLQELDKRGSVDAAFLLDHEPHFSARGDCRNQTHTMSRAGGLNNGRFTFFTPDAPGMVIGTDVGGIAKLDISPLFLRHSLDSRVFW